MLQRLRVTWRWRSERCGGGEADLWLVSRLYLSTFLYEEGRLSALTGDTAGAIRAYRHYLGLRPNPEPEVNSEVERVRGELAHLVGEHPKKLLH